MSVERVRLDGPPFRLQDARELALDLAARSAAGR